MDFYAGVAECVEEGAGGDVGADGVVEESDVEALAGFLLEGVGDFLTAVVVEEDVGFEPDAIFCGEDVADHGVEERG